MHTHRHDAYMQQLTSALFPVNAFLIVEPDGLTLIDTLYHGSCAAAIHAAAEHMGMPIRRIVLTHSHVDHAGSFDQLLTMLPAVETIIGSREAPLFAGNRALLSTEEASPLRGNYLRSTAQFTRTVTGGDMIGSLQVIDTPGHTPGHISLFDQRNGVLYCGDLFHTIGGITLASTLRWRFPMPYIATWSATQTTTSAQRCSALGAQFVAPGHGPIRTWERPNQ